MGKYRSVSKLRLEGPFGECFHESSDTGFVHDVVAPTYVGVLAVRDEFGGIIGKHDSVNAHRVNKRFWCSHAHGYCRINYGSCMGRHSVRKLANCIWYC